MNYLNILLLSILLHVYLINAINSHKTKKKTHNSKRKKPPIILNIPIKHLKSYTIKVNHGDEIILRIRGNISTGNVHRLTSFKGDKTSTIFVNIDTNVGIPDFEADNPEFANTDGFQIFLFKAKKIGIVTYKISKFSCDKQIIDNIDVTFKCDTDLRDV